MSIRIHPVPESKKIRYAVVGLGYISQGAVLPAFKHASANSKLTALVSDDHTKLKELSRKYRIKNTYTYKGFETCLRSNEIDAVYIALPNSQHLEFTQKAAEAGIHVLCEKPMAVTSEDCHAMILAAQENEIQLMIAYRLHFETMNQTVGALLRSGKIGDPRYMIASFGQQVKKGDIRLKKSLGGGTVYDMGVYCINAARYFFRSEPYEVIAYQASNEDPRFREVDEMTSATLRFPGERLASFVSSFGAADTSYCRIVGTKGDIIMEPAFDYSVPLSFQLTINGKKQKRQFAKTDQFAPELLHFSECILRNKRPEPSGREGWADVRIVEAIHQSAETRKAVTLPPFEVEKRPTLGQTLKRPPVRRLPELVNAESPSGE